MSSVRWFPCQATARVCPLAAISSAVLWPLVPIPITFLSTRSQPVQPLLAAMGMPDEVQRVADMLDVTTTIRHNGGAIEIIDATVRVVGWGDGGGGSLHASWLALNLPLPAVFALPNHT